jgi:hypothetical protein
MRVHPASEAKGLLRVLLLRFQQVPTHARVEFMRRSLLPEQADALQRLRGKTGQQKATVDHVHVHKDDQAIVGAATAKERDAGGGGR